MTTTGRIAVTIVSDAEAFRDVVELRRIVFGNEQRILLPRYEDPEDHFSFNLLATVDGQPAGTGRLTPAYERVIVPTIAWVAVLKEFGDWVSGRRSWRAWWPRLMRSIIQMSI